MSLEKLPRNKWLMLLAACLIHISIGSVYAYSTLVLPIIAETGWSLFATTFVFSIAILFLGTSASFGGRYVEKYGPTKTGLASAVLFATGLFGSALAISIHSAILMYLFAGVICGCAYGIGYVTPIKCIVSWFHKTPGLAGGACVMSFGFASMIAGPLQQYLVSSYNLVSNFLILGFAYLIVMIIASLYLDYPENINEQKQQDVKSLSVEEITRTWQFKALFISFFINIACGIALLSIVSPMAQELMNFSATRAAALVGIAGLSNGCGRIMWSGLSDYIGRPNTILTFMILEFIAFMLLPIISSEYVFELLIVIITSSYGAYFAVMPASLIDLFTYKHLSTIHGKILLAWGLAGLFSVPLIALIKTYIGTYTIAMYIFAAMIFVNLIIVYELKTKGFKELNS